MTKEILAKKLDSFMSQIIIALFLLFIIAAISELPKVQAILINGIKHHLLLGISLILFISVACWFIYLTEDGDDGP